MQTHTILEDVRSAMGPDRVFAEPRQQDGVTVIPSASIVGGGGGGGDDADGGGGFGVRAKPAGALVIEQDGAVKWKVPLDMNRIIVGGQIVGVAYFLFAWLTERSKARAAGKAAVRIAALSRGS